MKSGMISDKINQWKEIELTTDQLKEFTLEAAKLRFEDPAADIITNLNQVRRSADQGNDLWRAHNRVQENLIRGGFRNETTGRMVRPITNIQKDVNLNSDLWELSTQVAGKYSNN